MFEEGWKSFQLSEGVLEKETTEISRMIVDKIKRLVQAGTLHQSPVEQHYIEVTNRELPETLKDTAKMHAVVVRLTKVDQEKRGIPRNKRATGNPVRISGQFKGGLYRELTIFLRIYMDLAPTPEEFMQSINGWLPALKNLLRHEIEHARQHTKDDQGKYDKYSASGMGVYGDRRAAIEYFQSKEEKEAYVVGLYKKAKTEKKPFKEVFDDWIIEMRFHMLMNKKGEEEMPDSEVKKAFDQVEKDYLEYAKQRFPAAQGIHEGWRRYLNEVVELDIEVGDVLLGGKFKNKRVVVKSIGTNDLGQPTVNGKPLLNFRIEKQLPDNKKSKKTLELEKESENED